MNRTYSGALALLNQLQSNRTITSLFTAATPAVDLNARAIPEMHAWLRRAGYEASDLKRLRCIHVAGTKGKGSVCAYATSVLMRYRSPSSPVVGTYTSPHLVTVRERIALDGVPISQSMFTQYFFEVWDRFTRAAEQAGEVVAASEGGLEGPATKPFYFRFLTILAWHVFLSEGVRSAVIECGIGGEFDATNVLPADAVSAAVVTQLGIDHVNMLGDTVEKIAWHKAGVFKKDVPAFTRRLDENPAVMKVLRERAEEKSALLYEILDEDVEGWGGVDGRLKGAFQRYNQALAVAAVRKHLGMEWEEGKSPLDDLPAEFALGLREAHLRGRHEVIRYENADWFLDGAHTSDSLERVGNWFADQLGDDTVRILIFNQQERDAATLLTDLLEAIQGYAGRGSQPIFQHGLFARNDQTASGVDEPPRDLSVQVKAAEAMASFSLSTETAVFDNIEAVVAEVGRIARGAEQSGRRVKILGTGSLYLVGGLLRALEPGGLS
jgi:folylpolyglutamate synthase